MTDERPARPQTASASSAVRRNARPTTHPAKRPPTRIAVARPTVQATVTPLPHDLDTRHLGGLFATGDTADIPETVIVPPRRLVRRPARIARANDQPPVMADRDFRTLWTSRLMVQTAQGALLYALLIMVVDLSNRSLYNSLFVISSNIPSIVFGLAAGVVADSISRKALMITLNGFRFAFMIFLVGSQASLAGVFAATLGIWIIHQFYSPAEASMLGELVPPERYTSAQAMFNLALTISQAIGLVIAAPILLKLDGPRLVFAFSGALFLVAGALIATLPASRERAGAVAARQTESLRQSLGDGWRFIKRDRPTFEAVVDDVLVGVGMSALIVILPFYLERVLGTSKENTVFVFAPAALGLVIGLRLAPALGRSIGEQLTATMGLFVFALCVAALGFVNATYLFLNDTLNLPLDDVTNLIRIPPLVAMAMIISIPAGFASAIVNVAARSILLQRTPGQLRGRVIATQGLIGNVGSLLPTLIAGIAMDVFGVTPIAIAIAVCIGGLALVAHSYGKRSMRMPVPALN
ncbi:MAG: MFS transporter [Thermomicrobiales bacterium]